MMRLGPWPPDRPDYPIGLAVSGGADSLCLAVLARRWRKSVRAFVVDHGLRAESRDEADQTCVRLQKLGIASERLDLDTLSPGAGLQARAREARYEALTRAAIQSGCIDLLLGHHARDQAETLLMRKRAKSGPDGLAGMALSREMAMLRILRPLLDIAPERLRARLRLDNLDWIEDPSNGDLRYERVRYRQGLKPGRVSQVLHIAKHYGARRTRREKALARSLAAAVLVHPQHWALVSPCELEAQGWTRLISALVDARYDVSAHRLAAWLSEGAGPLTIGGVRIVRGGRLGSGLIVCVERPGAAPMRPTSLPSQTERLPGVVLAAIPPSDSLLEIVTGRAATSNSYWG